MKPFDKALWAALVVLLLMKYVGGGTLVPVATGPMQIVVVRESGDTTPGFSRTVTELRNGEAAAYLKSKNHRFDVWDDDVVDEKGQRLVNAEWIAGLALPAVVLLDGTSGRVLHRETLPATVTANAILELVKARDS